tara:strand:- start:423 stop:1781 length:1359 start_codon:yes stop_codon:yes gene_type:complete
MSTDMPQLVPYERGLIDAARDQIVSGLLSAGLYEENPYAAYRAAERILGILDFIPGVGEAKGAAETADAFDRGNLVEGGLLGAATLAGVVPGIGDAAAAPIKALAKRYTEVGAPVEKVDKKKGTTYLSKGVSEEQKIVERERAQIIKDMEEGGFDPMFPVEERYYADPEPYNLQGNTLTDTLPKKQQTIDKKIAQFDTPEARAALNEAFDRGQGPLAQDWYAMGQLEDAFIAELGPEAGRQAFKERFADAMAATTGGADPRSNLLMAAYGNFLKSKGMSPPGAAYEMPFPIGGRYVTGNMAMYDKVINQGKGLSAATTPKRFNFSANFLGDRSRATIDEQMTRGMTAAGPVLNAPPDGAYGIMEAIVGEEAAKRGVQPANFQDVSWAGFKDYEGKPMITEVNEMIERTARLTGKSPDEVLRGFITGNMPMYGLLGATTAGMIAGGNDEEADL